MTEKKLDGKNLTMLTDFYEMTMANGYLANGYKDTIAYFDMFFRRVPNGGGFAIMAGVQQLVDYLNDLTFTQEDIDYLRSTGIFSEAFLDYLADFRFCCDIHPGAADRDDASSHDQSSEPHRDKGKPHCSRRAGPRGDGVRLAPRPGA